MRAPAATSVTVRVGSAKQRPVDELRRTFMNETTITLIGNVVTDVQCHTTAAGTEAASFRLATTSRRYDKGIGAWVDGDTSFVRVTCWKRLARHVRESLTKGDPVIVSGAMKVREWEDRDGNRRTGVDVIASTVGHDLARGVTVFTRPPRGLDAAGEAASLDDSPKAASDEQTVTHVAPGSVESSEATAA
jgi:single-strand DNA-binding protein